MDSNILHVTPDISKRKCIIVAGMHRSGTSALTRVFNMMGGTLPHNIMPATEFNTSGHFESKTISFLNEAIMIDLGLSWSDIGPIDWASVTADRKADYNQRIRQAITEEYPDGGLLIIKDPRIGRLLPLWKDVLTDAALDASFALPVRHPIEVAQSLKNRDDFPLEMGCLLWLRYVLEAELHTRGLPRAFASYAELISVPGQTVARMVSTMGTDTPLSATQIETDVVSFIDPALRHHAADAVKLKRIGLLYPWIDQAYNAYGRLILDPDDQSAQAELDHVHKEFSDHADTFAPLVAFERQQAKILDQKLSAKLGSLQHQQDLRAVELAAALHQQTDQAARAASLEAQLAERLAYISSLEAQASQQLEHKASITTQLTEQTARSASLETQLAERLAHMTSLEAQLAERLAHVASIETQLSDQVLRIRDVEQQLADQTARADASDAKNRDQIESLQSMTERLDYQMSQKNALQAIANAQLVKVRALEASLAEEGERMAALLKSNSWRMTAPIRTIKTLIVRAKSGSDESH